MEYSEFVHWLAFAKHEPIGPARADVQTALLMTTLINLWSEKRAKVDEMIPDWWGEQAPSLSDKFMALAAALGGGTRGADPGDTGRQASA